MTYCKLGEVCIACKANWHNEIWLFYCTAITEQYKIAGAFATSSLSHTKRLSVTVYVCYVNQTCKLYTWSTTVMFMHCSTSNPSVQGVC